MEIIIKLEASNELLTTLNTIADAIGNLVNQARLEEKIADTDSTYAKEGTLAHEIAEKKLNKYFNGIDFDLETLKRDPLYNQEMNGYTDIYE